jgi:hypothetical protein
MALQIERYVDGHLFDRYDSIYDLDDTLGEVVAEILARGEQPVPLDQIDIAQPDGDVEIAWQAGVYQSGFAAANSLRNVLPPLDTQRILGIIRVFYFPPPVVHGFDREESHIRDPFPQLIGDFTEEQKNFINRVKGLSGLDLNRNQLLSAFKLLYPIADIKPLEVASTEQLEIRLLESIQSATVDFMRLDKDMRVSILAMVDNRTIHKICGASRATMEWCKQTHAFDEVFKRRHGAPEYFAFVNDRHPDNELNNGLWRLRAYEYVKTMQLFTVTFFIEKDGKYKTMLMMTTPKEHPEGLLTLKLRTMPIRSQALGSGHGEFWRLNEELIQLGEEIFFETVPMRFPGDVGPPRFRYGDFVGDVTQMERFMFRLFEWGAIFLDNLKISSGKDKAVLNVNQQCKTCGEGAEFQCKRCKSVRYCSDKCKDIGWKQGHKDECIGQSSCPPQPMPGVISKRKMTFGKELGKGAFGVVRAGTYLGKPVAIKTIQGTPTPEAIKEFSEEARLLGNIKPHPNVVQFIGITRDPLMLVTELVKGGALDSRLKSGKPPVQWTDIMKWARDIARGMRHLHSNNILHRDLATRNVLLDNRGNAKVTDFGLSRRICTRDKELRFRQQEFFRGPYKWMPPESMAANDFSVKSDVWAYGVTLWEIMSRRAPFEFVDINYVKIQVINSGLRLPLPVRWPQRLNDLMLSCWNPNPNSRPNMLAISTTLKAIGDTTYNRRQLPAISDNEIRQLYQ